jgi:RNAse (barnase) inhibitor barstar
MLYVGLNQVLRQAVPSGVYKTRSRFLPATIRQAVEQRSGRFFYLDGAQVKDKASFLAAAAQAFEFPDYFGKNWDAFSDCINDLSWAPSQRYVVLYDQADLFIETSPDDWDIALEILEEAAQRWQADGVSFHVLMRDHN